mmetsp:Transcript_33402/g.95867  ORF Transcript_33402/g.95867 Transcript_33402/m.95867 type:complete len:218 (+) Transcript_33402:2-655(+)
MGGRVARDAVHQPASASPASASSSMAHPLPWLVRAAGESSSPPKFPPTQRRAAAAGRASGISRREAIEQRKEIRAAFDAFDVDRIGRLDYEDVVAAVSALGLPMRKSEIRAAMREMDLSVEESETLDFDSFSSLLQGAYSARDPMDTMLESFWLFDREHQGKIGLEELQRAVPAELRKRGEVSDEELLSMLRTFDQNGDGEIDEEEFLRMMSLTALH